MLPLLTVTARFPIDKLGLMLEPDFPTPKGGWDDRTEMVTVTPPGGEPFTTPGLITSTHMCVTKGAKDRGWRIVVILFSCTPEQVPAGSVVTAPDDVASGLK